MVPGFFSVAEVNLASVRARTLSGNAPYKFPAGEYLQVTYTLGPSEAVPHPIFVDDFQTT